MTSYYFAQAQAIDPERNTITPPAKILVDGVCVGVFGWVRPLMAIVLLCDYYVMHESCCFCLLFILACAARSTSPVDMVQMIDY